MGRQYDDSLEFILDGVAEGVRDDGSCTNLTPSPEMRALWDKWQDNVRRSFDHWTQKPTHNRLMKVTVGELFNLEPHYDADVYFTLSGAGIGLWDGRWEPYFTNQAAIDNLERHLKRWLKRSHEAIEAALFEEAMEQCGEAS